MKKLLMAFGVLVIGGAGGMAIMAARFEERIKPNTFVGLVPVGDLSRDDAMKKLRVWWETERRRELIVRIPDSRTGDLRATAGKLGITIDDVESISSLPLDTFWDSAQRTVTSAEAEKRQFDVKFKSNGQPTAWLADRVRASVGSPAPAKVTYANGVITRTPEIAGSTLDQEKLPTAVLAALSSDGIVQVPVIQAEKRIPDEQLNQITDVVAEFSTRFPVSQTSRNANLNLASGEIDGLILMPGEIFSFNGHLGKRTAEEGYRMAGVYNQGRHDVAIGGGICQVSTTLYNAAVLSNLKIVQRSNHSMPVAYVPIGRDAAVSYPSLDMKFQNTMDTPIAISRTFAPGRLTFRILGKKDPTQEVQIVVSGRRSWGTGVKYVNDASLPPGKQKVIEKGSSGHAAVTHRIVRRNGVVVSREHLANSHYRGGTRIIAVNRSKASPASVANSAPAPVGDAPEQLAPEGETP